MIQEAEPQWEAFHTTHQQQREWAPGIDEADVRKVAERHPSLRMPSEPDPVLDISMSDALLRILLTADGAVSSYTAPLEIVKAPVDRSDAKQRLLAEAKPYNHTGKASESKVPTSDLGKIIDALSNRYHRARTDLDRLVVLGEAQAILARLKHSRRKEMRGTTEWKKAIANDNRPSRVVAALYHVSKRDVTAYRKAFRGIA